MSNNGSRRNGQKSVSGSHDAPTSESVRLSLHQVLAANLRRSIDVKGVSKPDLARRAGFTLDELEAIFRGEFEGLTKGDVEALAKALDMETTDLLERDV